MEDKKELEKMLQVYTMPFWGREEIAFITGCGLNRATQIKFEALKMCGVTKMTHKKVSRDAVCRILNIDAYKEIEMIEKVLRIGTNDKTVDAL